MQGLYKCNVGRVGKVGRTEYFLVLPIIVLLFPADVWKNIYLKATLTVYTG